MAEKSPSVEEITRRWAKVTGGQWQIWPANGVAQAERAERRIYTVTPGEKPWQQPKWGKEIAWLREPSNWLVDETHANAVAIVAAPTDIAFLLAEVARLEEEKERDWELVAAVEAWSDARITKIEAIGTDDYWQAENEQDLASATLRTVLKERRKRDGRESRFVRGNQE